MHKWKRMIRAGEKLANLGLQVTLGRSRLCHAQCCNRRVTRDLKMRDSRRGLGGWGRGVTAVQGRDFLTGRGFHGGNLSPLGVSLAFRAYNHRCRC